MNLAEQNELAEKFFAQCRELLITKGKDYTPEDVAFKDVDGIANEIGSTPERVLWVYFRKHYTAIRHFILHGDVKSEPIDTRLVDLANYCALLYVLINRKK